MFICTRQATRRVASVWNENLCHQHCHSNSCIRFFPKPPVSSQRITLVQSKKLHYCRFSTTYKDIKSDIQFSASSDPATIHHQPTPPARQIIPESRLYLSSCVQLENSWPPPNDDNSLEACAKRIAAKKLPPDHILWQDSFDSPKAGAITYDINPHSNRRAAWIEYPSTRSDTGIQMESYYSGEVNSLGQRHGWGLQVYLDGVPFYTCGKWRDDKMIQRRPVPFDHLIWKRPSLRVRAAEEHPHGLLFQDDGFYDGEIDRTEMLPHGQGTLKLIMGNPAKFWIQQGQFHLGVLHGSHCLVHSEDEEESYHGDMQMGLRHGVGTHRKQFVQYDGEWCNGKKHGEGVEKDFQSGTTLTGTWEQGKWNSMTGKVQ